MLSAAPYPLIAPSLPPSTRRRSIPVPGYTWHKQITLKSLNPDLLVRRKWTIPLHKAAMQCTTRYLQSSSWALQRPLRQPQYPPCVGFARRPTLLSSASSIPPLAVSSPPLLAQFCACVSRASYRLISTSEINSFRDPVHSLFSLTGHLRLELGLLAEIAVRLGSGKRIKVLLPDRKEDATEIGWDTSARRPHHSQALLRLTKPVWVDRGDTHHVFYG